MPLDRAYEPSTAYRLERRRAPDDAERDDLAPYLRDGKLSAATPARVVHQLQRMVGNRALTAVLADRPPTVQRLGVSGILDKLFGAQPKRESLEQIALNKVAWQHFRAFAKREYSTENCDYFEEYVRAKSSGGGGNNQRLYDMVMDTGEGELNITEAQRAEIKRKGEKLFWSRPLSIFEPVTMTVKTNLADTFSRFQNHPHGKKAAQALTRGETTRTKVGRFLGEQQSRKESWISDAESMELKQGEEDRATI